MDTVEIVFDSEGRLVPPRALRLRLPARYIVQDEPPETDEAREARLDAFYRETERLLKDVPRKELCDADPLVAKYRRMGLLD